MYRNSLKILILFALLALSAFPAFAQTGNRVAFDGVSFAYNDSLASNVNISQYAGDPAELGFGAAEPAHTQFTLYNTFPVPESLLDAVGGVRVYRITDFVGYTEHESRLAQLQTLLNERPDLAASEAISRTNEALLPFIPVFAAGQVIRTKAQYLATEQVQGISYVTIYQEVAEPFLADSFIYTFQGISTDGQYYISAIFNLNVTADFLPAELPADFDPAVFSEQLGEYLAKNAAWLDELPAENFSPNLNDLDALVQSITFAE